MISEKKDNKKIKCTVGILTFNSEKTLLKCLESVSDFSEIIICDGGSTDKTIDIAKKFGCIVLQQDKKFKYKNNKISNFSGVRNQLLKKASHDWFMFIDSDEFLSETLVVELHEIITSWRVEYIGVYNMPRKFILHEKIIDCASSYPNYQIRFFKKDHVNSFTKKVHERIHVKENTNVGVLVNHVMVPIEEDDSLVKIKHAYYLKIEYERSLIQPYSVLFFAFRFNSRALFGRLFKCTKSLLMCRGTRLPLYREILNMRYTIRLLFIFSKIAAKRFFNKNNNL